MIQTSTAAMASGVPFASVISQAIARQPAEIMRLNDAFRAMGDVPHSLMLDTEDHFLRSEQKQRENEARSGRVDGVAEALVKRGHRVTILRGQPEGGASAEFPSVGGRRGLVRVIHDSADCPTLSSDCEVTAGAFRHFDMEERFLESTQPIISHGIHGGAVGLHLMGKLQDAAIFDAVVQRFGAFIEPATVAKATSLAKLFGPTYKVAYSPEEGELDYRPDLLLPLRVGLLVYQKFGQQEHDTALSDGLAIWEGARQALAGRWSAEDLRDVGHALTNTPLVGQPIEIAALRLGECLIAAGTFVFDLQARLDRLSRRHLWMPHAAFSRTYFESVVLGGAEALLGEIKNRSGYQPVKLHTRRQGFVNRLSGESTIPAAAIEMNGEVREMREMLGLTGFAQPTIRFNPALDPDLSRFLAEVDRIVSGGTQSFWRS